MFVLSNNSQRFLYLIVLIGVVMISSNMGKLEKFTLITFNTYKLKILEKI
jgi:hypothetical protein